MSALKQTFWLGTGLILLTNAVVLGGVYYNRSGEPDSVLRLSERELSMAYRGFLEESDDSGQVLQLDVRVADGWVTEQKLQALGFQVEDDRPYERAERDGLVVLEVNGHRYQTELQAAQASLTKAQDEFAAAPQDPEAMQAQESAQYDVDRLQRITTRLYVVDAGLDAAALRERYPDTKTYALARATIRYGTRYYGENDANKGYELYVDLTELNVPAQWREVFSDWQYYNRSAEDRSTVSVELAFGKRFEPWVIAAKKAD